MQSSPALPAAVIRARRFVILASQFNPSLSRALVDGAREVLLHAGAFAPRIEVFWVPGAFELPVAASRLARRHPQPDAIIAVGTLVRGDTPQYAVLAHAVAEGLTQVAVDTGIPVTFGVIVAETPAQALARAGGTEGNRGAEAARAALGVLQLFERVDDRAQTHRSARARRTR